MPDNSSIFTAEALSFYRSDNHLTGTHRSTVFSRLRLVYLLLILFVVGLTVILFVPVSTPAVPIGVRLTKDVTTGNYYLSATGERQLPTNLLPAEGTLCGPNGSLCREGMVRELPAGILFTLPPDNEEELPEEALGALTLQTPGTMSILDLLAQSI